MMYTKAVKISIAVLLLIMIVGIPLWAQRRGGTGRETRGPENSSVSGIEAMISGIEPTALTVSEKEGVLLMREEEKLARDIYLTLGEYWNIPIFMNIARSEETHMASMELLIDRYGLMDPVETTDRSSRGEYSNEQFGELYRELTERGTQSFEEALKVGAMVEELDIADLRRLLEEGDNEDVDIVYQNLLKGSRNHLRSFHRQLVRNSGEYVPKYITEEDYTRIWSSRNETGVIMEPEYRF